jgi:hypothetical protein
VSPDEISIQISSLNKEDWPWTEGVAEVVESLPNKCEALSSKQSTAKTNTLTNDGGHHPIR